MRMSRRRRRAGSETDSTPSWLLTYSDMVTLLLTFFILLYSYSVIDVQRFQEVLSSIQVAFLGHEGVLESTPLPAENEEDDSPPIETPAQIDPIIITYEAVKLYILEQGMEDYVHPRLEERGVVLEIEDNILFDSGRAEIKEEAAEVLKKISGILKSVTNQIIVEGHTDNIPINTARYPSNWELSVDRAVRVVRYFIEKHHMPPERFLATGYGEYHPVATNETVEGRARNRRVNIVISNVNLLDKGGHD